MEEIGYLVELVESRLVGSDIVYVVVIDVDGNVVFFI